MSEYYGERRRGCLPGCLVAVGVIVGIGVLAVLFVPRLGVRMMISDSALSPVPREARAAIRQGVDEAIGRLGKYGVTREEAVGILNDLSARELRSVIDALRAAPSLDGETILREAGRVADLSGVDLEAAAAAIDERLDEEAFRRTLEGMTLGPAVFDAVFPSVKQAVREAILAREE
jgi:hypothetical protein